MNNKIVPLPPPIPSNYPGVPPKQPSTYLNVTEHCKLRPVSMMGIQFPNSIHISWLPDIMARQYIFTLRLVQKLRGNL